MPLRGVHSSLPQRCSKGRCSGTLTYLGSYILCNILMVSWLTFSINRIDEEHLKTEKYTLYRV